MDPLKNVDLTMNFETNVNPKVNPTKTVNPVLMPFQPFASEIMNQTNQANSRPRLLAPASNWTIGLQNDNFVNSSIQQRKYPFPPFQPLGQERFPLNQFSYYTPFAFQQATLNAKHTPRNTLNQDDWRNKTPSKTLSKQYDAPGNSVMPASKARSSSEISSTNQLFRQCLPANIAGNISKHSSEKSMHSTNLNQKYFYTNVASRNIVSHDRSGNLLSRQTSEANHFHPYIEKRSFSENSDCNYHRKRSISESSGYDSGIPGMQKRKTESVYKIPYINGNLSSGSKSRKIIGNTESGMTSGTNSLPVEKGNEYEENMKEYLSNKNADELLLSMTNRRIKINRLLEEQKRLMENLHVMKSESLINNINDDTEI